jgi:hypothetical protein
MKVSVQIIYGFIVAVTIILPLPDQQYRVDAFVPTCHQPRLAITTSTLGRKRKNASSSSLWYADSPEDSLSEMKASDMKKELEESYGVSTKSMFDKKEFEKALKDARLNVIKEKRKARAATTTTNEEEEKEDDKQVATSSDSSGKETTSIWGKPKTGDDNNKNKTPETWSSRWKDMASTAKEVLDSNTKKFSDYKSSKEKSSSSSSSSSSSTSSNTRQQRYDLALEEGAAMKLSSLKSELKDRGISTASFFEKSDLINAYANAIADNINNNKRSTKSTNTSSRSSNNNSFDPSYKTVTMHSFNPSSFLSGEVIIDITAETVL